MAESKKEKILEYKGKPLVRCGKTIYYGSMSDPYVICLNILSDEDIKGLKVSGKVAIQLIDTDPSVTSPKEKIIKKSEKQGLFNALDLGAVWLERALKKHNLKEKASFGAHYIKNNCSKNKETAKYCVKITAQAASLHYNLCLVFHLFLLFLSAKQFKQTDFVQCALIKSC